MEGLKQGKKHLNVKNVKVQVWMDERIGGRKKTGSFKGWIEVDMFE